ncbi:hypothetical protein [Halogeometricum limi]|uniref:Uncharacterized protein n=1 Tax=Halogeometricum limi TaxID=555875 RepID=A0A1I6GRC6_9EURY|nr:hypothetical protein [Halogeometricum limi]SFR44782.1 hypothetical protein SAMN04488124_1438 [Halogeometricum limi]
MRLRPPVRSIAVGDDVRATGRYVALAVALLPAVLLACELLFSQQTGDAMTFPSSLTALVVGGSSLAAYRTRGVAAPLSFGVFPPLGLAAFFGLGLPQGPIGEQLAAVAAGPTLGFGLAIAGFGWLFGTTARHLLASMSPPADPA